MPGPIPINPLALPSTLLKVLSLGMERDAESKAAKLNSAELERVAKLEDANAVDSLVRGNILAGQARTKGSLTVAAQRVAYAASGVDSSVGTPAAVAGATRMMSELDAQTLENNARREAWSHKEVGTKYRFQKAQLDTAEADASAGFGLKVVGSILGGGLL